ncbi:MAG: hypothetical protein LBQ76_00295 [Candidatus Fibromonas sp.]|jgi:hypothetical protein|nr:hypothetical protein [Candidatus Fibromonas sp.]
MKIQNNTAKLAKLSVAALLAGVSIAAAEEEAPVVTPGGTKVQIYGRLELNSAYEDGITGGLWSANATSNANKDAQGRTSLSIARTRLGLNLVGPSKEGEPDLNGKFEADFAGNSGYNNFNGSGSVTADYSGAPGFRVRQSYGSVKFKGIGLTLLFGMTDDLITPIDPPSINPSSLNGAGNLGNRRPQIRVTQALGPVEIAVAATHDRLRANDNVASSSPGVQGRLGVKLPATWAGEKANIALGVGGLFAKDEAANADDENRAKRGPSTNSINADLSLPIINILTLTGEFFTGQNLTRYGDGSLGLNHTSSSNPTKVKEDGISSIGWWAALAAKLPANLSAATGVGMEAVDGDVVKDDLEKSDKIPGSRESNMFIFANLGYNFTSAAKLTFEYLNLATDYADKLNGDKTDKGYLNRFELNFRYDFK